MSISKSQNPVVRYSREHSLAAGPEFVKAIVGIPIAKVLDQSTTLWQVPRVAGKLAGIEVKMEGNDRAQGIVSGAYENVFQLLDPSRFDLTPNELRNAIQSKETLHTLAMLAASLSTRGMAKGVLTRYEEQGEYLKREDTAISVEDNSFLSDEKLLSKNGGCPYATEKGAKLAMFYRLAIHAGDTYATAIERDMPRTRRELARRAFGTLFR